MFKKIMFATTATPTSDAAAKIAFELAEKYKSELTAFHVFGIPSRGHSSVVSNLRTGVKESTGPDYESWAREELEATYEPLTAKYGKPNFASVAGIPATEILRKARSEETDLIVMGAHTREEDVGSTRFRGIVGSTMQKVAQKARCPVLIVSRPCANCFWYFNKIIFGVDFTKASLHAFKFALKVASEIGCKLYLFHAIDISSMQVGKAEGQEAIEDRITAAKERIEKEYVSQMEDFDNYEISVWEGVPYVELLKFARETSSDLIVMAHHTRDVDPDKALLGSTVEQVVLRAACPVASVNR